MGDSLEFKEKEGWSEIETAVLSDDNVEALEPAETAYLIVLAGQRVGEMVKVSKEMSIGRATDADFQVVDEGISRTHLLLTQRPDGTVVLRDAGSLNGTLVNNQKVAEAVLKDGDKIRIGSTAILKFSYSDQLDKRFQQEMFEATVQDPLTGLYNRRRLMEQLELQFKYSRRHGIAVTLIIIDIDHFKSVNDTYGHAVGDELLRGFGEMLSKITRNEDLAARYGGEEFVLLCRGLDQMVGAKVAERVRQYVEQTQFLPDNPEVQVTISAGVASIPHPRITSGAQLIEAADKALYLAKSSGRNQVIVSS